MTAGKNAITGKGQIRRGSADWDLRGNNFFQFPLPLVGLGASLSQFIIGTLHSFPTS